MSVYFAQVGRYVKVGYSEDPEKRVRNLFKSATRYGAPKDIDSITPRTLLAFVPGRTNQERGAHMALDDFRVFGEWFIDEPEVRDYIARCVDANAVVAKAIARPAGSFRWDEDPILKPGLWGDRLAADAFSAVMREHGVGPHLADSA